MQHSDSIKALAAALSKAQCEIENAHKTSDNPFFRSRYADLAEIINTARPVLARHGLSVVQVPGIDGDTVSVETILLHESGEWLSGVSGSPMAKQYRKDGAELPPSPQAVGSSITYLRRYALAAFCCMAQEDDDGNAAGQQGEQQKRAPTKATQKATSEAATGGQVALIRRIMKSHVITDSERTRIETEIGAGGMTKQRAKACIDWLQGEVGARKAIEKAEREEAEA